MELSFDGFDPTATYQYTDTTRNQNLFNRGDIIWNLTELALQVYDGAEWQALYAPSGKGVGATGELGTITVQASGYHCYRKNTAENLQAGPNIGGLKKVNRYDCQAQ